MHGSIRKPSGRGIPKKIQPLLRLVSGAPIAAVFALWMAQSSLLMGQTPKAEAPPLADQWKNAPAASSGIAVGKKIPPFQLRDQTGRLQDFNSIRGPKGAAIYFMRSADW